MPKKPISIRIDPKIHAQAVKKAKQAGLNLSQIVQFFLADFAEGTMHVGVIPTKYPPGYIEQLEKEALELEELHRQGKAKSYASAEEMFADILGD